MRSEQKDALWFILHIILVLLIGFFIGMGVAVGETNINLEQQNEQRE